MSELPTLTGLKHTFKSLQDVDVTSFAPNDILVINNDGSKIIQQTASSLLPPIIGTGITNDIPVFSGSYPPIFVDSGFQVGNLSIPNPPFLPLQAHYINLKPSAGIDQVIASVNDPNTGSDLVFFGVGAMTGNADLQIGNQSSNPNHNLGISNFSPNGTTYVSGDTVSLNNNNNISVQLSSVSAGIYDGLNQNYIASDLSGIGINSFSGSQNISLYNSNGNNSILMNGGGIGINNNNASTLNLNNGSSTLQGNTQVIMQDNNNNSVFIQNNKIVMNDANDSNSVQVSPNGIDIQTQNAGQYINLSNLDGNDTINMDVAGIDIKSLSSRVNLTAGVGINQLAPQINLNNTFIDSFQNITNLHNVGFDVNNTLECSGAQMRLISQNDATIYNSTSGSFLDLTNTLSTLASNSFVPLQINATGNLQIQANSTTGVNGQVLTTDGTNCRWQTPINQNICMASINSVPAAGAWIAYTGFIPYNDVALSYGGQQLQNGSSVSYNNATHLFTVVDAGIYNVMVVQNVDINNALGFVQTDGRLALYTSTLAPINQDSGRFQTTPQMSVAGILSLNYQLNVVAYLNAGDYGIFATAEPNGILLGKGSCVFTRVT
jgi:hypothetical protein